eukprot:jgi/Bigna1/143233/aug1.77_g17941
MNNMLNFLRKRGSSKAFRSGKHESAAAVIMDANGTRDFAQKSEQGLVPGEVTQTLTDWPPIFSDITKRRSDVKKLRSYMDGLSSSMETFAKGLRRVSELPAMEINTSFSGNWEKMKDTTRRLANYYEDVADKIQKRVLLGILECKHQIRTEQDRLQAQSSRLLNEMQGLQSKHEQRKKKYFEATEKAHLALNAEKKSRAEGQGSTKKHEKLMSQRATRVKDAKAAHEKYQIALQNLQTVQKT